MNWDAVGAVGEWVGAIATTAAVVVALWQVNQSAKSHLKQSYQLSEHERDAQLYNDLYVKVANKGSHAVTIEKFGILLSTSEELEYPPYNVLIPYASYISTEEPLVIHERQSLVINVRLHELAQMLEERNLRGRVKLRMYIQDATGDRHWQKWTFDTERQVPVR